MYENPVYLTLVHKLRDSQELDEPGLFIQLPPDTGVVELLAGAWPLILLLAKLYSDKLGGTVNQLGEALSEIDPFDPDPPRTLRLVPPSDS